SGEGRERRDEQGGQQANNTQRQARDRPHHDPPAAVHPTAGFCTRASARRLFERAKDNELRARVSRARRVPDPTWTGTTPDSAIERLLKCALIGRERPAAHGFRAPSAERGHSMATFNRREFIKASGAAAAAPLISVEARGQGKTVVNMQLGWLLSGNQIGEVCAKQL